MIALNRCPSGWVQWSSCQRHSPRSAGTCSPFPRPAQLSDRWIPAKGRRWLMLATLVGLSMLLALVGGTATLAGCLLAPRLRARQARRYPEQAASRQHTRQARRLAAEWPLMSQTLGLGYRDQWTRQHRFPTAEFVADDQGVTATVAAIAGAGLADYQRAAGYLADTWGCVTVRAEQQGPGLIRLRGLHRDPLLDLARVDLSGIAPASLDAWWLGW